MSNNFASQLTSVEISVNVANNIQQALTALLEKVNKIDADGQANAQRIDQESKKTHQQIEDLTATINAITSVREPRHQRTDLSPVRRTQLDFNTPPTGANDLSLELGGPRNTTPSRILNHRGAILNHPGASLNRASLNRPDTSLNLPSPDPNVTSILNYSQPGVEHVSPDTDRDSQDAYRVILRTARNHPHTDRDPRGTYFDLTGADRNMPNLNYDPASTIREFPNIIYDPIRDDHRQPSSSEDPNNTVNDNTIVDDMKKLLSE
ncbi:unnamed protein product [Cochlearia groenlandica]